MSFRLKAVLVVILALAVIGVIHWMADEDPVQLAARGVGKDPHAHQQHHGEEDEEEPTLEELTSPMGRADAPVTVSVFYDDPAGLQRTLRPIVEGAYAKFGDQIHVEFRSLSKEENRQIIVEHGAGVLPAVLINGEAVKETPDSAFGMVSFLGSPEFAEWTPQELYSAIETELADEDGEGEAETQAEADEEEGE